MLILSTFEMKSLLSGVLKRNRTISKFSIDLSPNLRGYVMLTYMVKLQMSRMVQTIG